VPALFENILIPALSLAETDRHRGALDAERGRFAFDTTRQIAEEVNAGEPVAQDACRHVCIVPAHDEADEVAGAMLARLIPGAQRFAAGSLAAETLDKVDTEGCRIVCISAVPPRAASHAAYLVRRLKQQFPKKRIVVGLWSTETIDKVKPRLLEAGADDVLTRLAEAAAQLRQLK